MALVSSQPATAFNRGAKLKRELAKLLRDATNRYQRFAYRGAAGLDALANDLVASALATSGLATSGLARISPRPSATFAAHFARLTRALLAFEPRLQPPPALDGALASDTPTMRLVHDAAQHVHFLRQPDPALADLHELIANLANVLARHCQALRDDEGATPFRVALLDLLDEPGEAITDAILAVITSTSGNSKTARPLLAPLADQLLHNLYHASGIDPASDKQPSLPREQDAPPAELVATFCGGTPLTDFLAAKVPFALPDDRRTEGTWIVGRTGSGKSTLISELAWAQIHDPKRSLVILDSQIDLIRLLTSRAEFHPDGELAKRLVILDCDDLVTPLGINMFDLAPGTRPDPHSQEGKAETIRSLELYDYLFGALLGADMTAKQGVLFRFAAQLMMSIPGANLATLMDLFRNPSDFRQAIDQLPADPRDFLNDNLFAKNFAATQTQIKNRLWTVKANPAVGGILSSATTNFDMRQLIDNGAIICISTAVGVVGQMASDILGRLFMAMLTQALFSRQSQEFEDRTPVDIYADEAQNWVDSVITPKLFVQARKLNGRFAIAHQYVGQLKPENRQAAATAAIKIAGGLKDEDARALAPDFRAKPAELMTYQIDKAAGTTDFACFIAGHTERPVRLTIELGRIANLPKLSAADYQRLLDDNRARYAQQPAEATPAPQPSPDPTRPLDLTAEGQASPEHRAMQALIKARGEALGFRVTLEAPVPGTRYRNDARLEAPGITIALEVAHATNVAGELHNITKTPPGSVDHFIVLSTKPDHLAAIKAQASAALAADQFDQIAFVLPHQLTDIITPLAPAAGAADPVFEDMNSDAAKARAQAAYDLITAKKPRS